MSWNSQEPAPKRAPNLAPEPGDAQFANQEYLAPGERARPNAATPGVARRRAVPVTITLVVANVLVFLATNGLSNSATNPGLVDAGVMYGPAINAGEWWRIFTSAFMHAGFAHIAFNMMALLQVGTIVETYLGSWRMIVIYTFAILTSALFIYHFSFNAPSLGASGAIFGLFGALVGIGLHLGKQGQMLVGQVVPIIAINLGLGFLIPNISMSAHVGGLIGGFLIVFALLSGKRKTANTRSTS